MGIKHLISGPHRALFADMGTGKTGMTLAALDHLFMAGELKGALIIAPLRVCNLTWWNEVQHWDEFRWMKVANLRTKEGIKAWQEGSAQIYTINFESLPTFVTKYIEGKSAEKLPVCTLVWDELSRAKNPSSFRVNTLRAHWAKFTRHWGLTGTPSPNSKLDLFAQYRLLDGGERLGTHYFQFRAKYFYAVDRDQYEWKMMAGMENALESRVADMTLVLRARDWLKDVPAVEEVDIEVPLPPVVQPMYKQLTKELLVMIANHEIDAVNAAVLVSKLIQITSGAIYTAEREEARGGVFEIIPKTTLQLHDTKIKALAALKKQLDGHPLLVTYQFRHEEERLREAFPDAVCFSDAKNNKTQQELLKQWNNREIPMLIISPQSGGHGLNMQFGGCDIVWFSLSWSREYYDQLNARLARPGQDQVTRVYRLICPKTMDDAVAEALRQKGEGQAALMDAIMNFKHLNETK